MTALLVFLQSSSGSLPKGTLATLSAAHELKKAWGKNEIYGICLGAQAKQAAESALVYGLSKVFYSEEAALSKYLASPYSQALVQALKHCGADTLVAPASSIGKDVCPRVAGVLDAAQASDVIAVNSDGSLKRPMYAGNAFAEVELTSAARVVTVRTTAFSPYAATSAAGSIEELKVQLDLSKAGEVVSYALSTSARPELADAAVVVSGGRAMQSAENFEKYIFPLADAFGAAVGASRAAVDSGYAPNDWQVGQTGKVVAPGLYVAVGISGAIQHLAGMKDSKVIVAINKDPDAPIYEVADYGLVADLYQAVPLLTEAVKKAKGQ
ncbi:MAG: electron transfer flavoprotein subunit alpha/FixB family protein [Deltaproteobacteria bacterium]|nr:electron transfer flavoprotein subunit alpha/FixB family protein [Deltaproteobacteria bacterium]